MTSLRVIGAALGAMLGLVAMFAPIGLESWYPGLTGYPAPPAVGAILGSAGAGFLLAPKAVLMARSKLGLLAAFFAVVAAICAAPFFGLGGAVWSIVVPPEPGDEIFHPGPFMSAVLDIVFFGVVALLLAIPQGIAWVWLMSRVRFSPVRTHVTFTDPDRAEI